MSAAYATYARTEHDVMRIRIFQKGT